MKNKKKTWTLVAALAVLVVGIFTVRTYIGNSPSSDDACGLLTPQSDEMEGLIINDPLVPLGPSADGPGAETTESSYVQQIADLVNAEREKADLEPLTLDPQINVAAQTRAEEQFTLFSHSRPNGSKYLTVLDENGISYRGCGENVAYGFSSPEAVMEAWMNSEGHKANILNENYSHIGVGYYKGSNGYHYWSQLFTYQ